MLKYMPARAHAVHADAKDFVQRRRRMTFAVTADTIGKCIGEIRLQFELARSQNSRLLSALIQVVGASQMDRKLLGFSSIPFIP